jgi:hypothetical protein
MYGKRKTTNLSKYKYITLIYNAPSRVTITFSVRTYRLFLTKR